MRRTHLVLEVDGRIEVGDLGIDGLANYFALAGVQELAHFCGGQHRGRGN